MKRDGGLAEPLSSSHEDIFKLEDKKINTKWPSYQEVTGETNLKTHVLP
jgi:hypothetical protein